MPTDSMAVQFPLKKDRKTKIYHRFPGSFALVKLALKNVGANDIVLTGGGNPIEFNLVAGEGLIITFDGEWINASGDSVLEVT